MALHDLGLVPFEEPFPRIRLGGMIVRHGAKMSKSRGNVVTPDDYIDEHGADVLRCALLFAAPWEQGGDFSDDGIVGIERFFARAWRVITGPDVTENHSPTIATCIVEVTDAIERLAFNVGLARLMEYLPAARSASDKRVFVRLLAPFAPHLAEELWSQLGEPVSVHNQPWPIADPAALEPEAVEIVIQVDGRVRGTVEAPPGVEEGEIVIAARQSISTVPSHEETRKTIFVPDRILNFVTRGR
jgi:leucyl-tRNA synthetase